MLGANASEHQCSWETSQLPLTSSQPRASVPACWLTSQQMNELNHIRLILHQGHLVGDEAANYKEGNINSLVLRSHMTYFGNHMTIQRRHCCHVHINTKQHSLVEEGLECALSKQLCKQQHSQLPLGYVIDVQCYRDRRRERWEEFLWH